MKPIRRCPECDALWQNSLTCRNHFEQMLAWEFEDPGRAGAIHHLTVLCYNLQHPGNYSPQGLALGMKLLAQFLESGSSPQQIRKQNNKALDSGKRAFKIKGAPEAHGMYDHPVYWTMTVGDVTAGGLDDYIERVQAWASSIYAVLKDSGNYSSI